MKVLGTQYGIQITRPWNKEMYEHNDKVSSTMKEAITQALNKAYKEKDETNLRVISKAICSYGHGDSYGLDSIYADARTELDRIQNYWLNDHCWPDLVKAGIVQDIPTKFVGYK
jgi:hypothetical protein